ncbi:hypothetical protein M885DRAFT_493680 [Pelagophyceae sp. CCMP2097]|nr:hypothetical protein M885DRAFT_493680 [Pelagophyceae sp. CCMP2097]
MAVSAVAQARVDLEAAFTKAKRVLEKRTYTNELLSRLEAARTTLESTLGSLKRAEAAQLGLKMQLGLSEAAAKESSFFCDGLKKHRLVAETHWQTVVDEYEQGMSRLEAELADLACKLRVAEQTLRDRDLELHMTKIHNAGNSVETEKLRIRVKALEGAVSGRDERGAFLESTEH